MEKDVEGGRDLSKEEVVKLQRVLTPLMDELTPCYREELYNGFILDSRKNTIEVTTIEGAVLYSLNASTLEYSCCTYEEARVLKEVISELNKEFSWKIKGITVNTIYFGDLQTGSMWGVKEGKEDLIDISLWGITE